MIYSDIYQTEYLGCLSCGKYESDSIFNSSGEYGSCDLSDSNLFCRGNSVQYGSKNLLAQNSACNPSALDPPAIVDEYGNYYGRFSISTTPNIISISTKATLLNIGGSEEVQQATGEIQQAMNIVNKFKLEFGELLTGSSNELTSPVALPSKVPDLVQILENVTRGTDAHNLLTAIVTYQTNLERILLTIYRYRIMFIRFGLNKMLDNFFSDQMGVNLHADEMGVNSFANLIINYNEGFIAGFCEKIMGEIQDTSRESLRFSNCYKNAYDALRKDLQNYHIDLYPILDFKYFSLGGHDDSGCYQHGKFYNKDICQSVKWVCEQ